LAGQRFAKSIAEFTNGCNACHQSIERGFVVMRVPTESPFTDQVLPPQERGVVTSISRGGDCRILRDADAAK